MMPVNSTVIYSAIPVKPESTFTFNSSRVSKRLPYRLSDCVVC